MNQPTEEQIREFWEWCGFDVGEYTDEWVAPDNYTCFHGIPPIDLNNLFKYAVPKLSYCFLNSVWLDDLNRMGHRAAVGCPNNIGTTIDLLEDPALALFWALQEMKEGL